MLTVKWETSWGDTGQVALTEADKWTFGRHGGDEVPTVATDDPRISRNALTVRDSGPGPVVFRGQRGDAVSVTVVNADGTERPIAEGTAAHLDEESRRIEVSADGDVLLRVQVLFDLRPSVKERQELADATDLDGDALSDEY